MTLLGDGDIKRMSDQLLELSNAVLIEIATPGTLDRYGDPGTSTPAWTGRASGFLERQNRDELANANQGAIELQTSIDLTTFLIFDAEGAPVLEVAGPDWQGSTVVIEDWRLGSPLPRRFSVVGFEHQADHTLDSVLLTLNNETTP